MKTLTATDAQKDFIELLKSAQEKHEVYHIQYCDGDAVLMSKNEYDELLETMHLLSAQGFREEFDQSVQEAANGQTESFEEVFGETQ